VSTPPEVVASCQAVLRHHAKTFRWAQMFLGTIAQQDAAIAYAFCRGVDDAVDEAQSAAQAAAQLDEWADELEGRSLPRPVVAAFRELATRCGFGLVPARELMMGARSDLGSVLLRDDQELWLYCYRVAGTVGAMMAAILGAPPEAEQHAVDLGIGMQLTNICRDVLEDGQRGRVYLPEERLAAVGLTSTQLLRPPEQWSLQDRRRLAQVIQQLLTEADLRYDSGREGLRYLPPRAALAIAVAARLYQGIGHRLLKRYQGDPLFGRTRVPFTSKLRLTGLALGDWGQDLWRRWGDPHSRAGAEPSPLPAVG
jgi:phytoene synthase